MKTEPSFGGSVRLARQARNLNQRDLAKLLGVAPLVLSKIERDELQPSVQVLERVQQELGLTPPPSESELESTREMLLDSPRHVNSSVSLTRPAQAPLDASSASAPLVMSSELDKRGYVLKQQIGIGGFGAVYRAEQRSVGRDVAIKVVRPELADDTDFIRRFEAEARMVARLEHVNIVPLYDFWREAGAAFMVMRLLRGGSLAERLRATGAKPLNLLQLIHQVGQALHAAHAAGIVHRDLKPANVLLDEQDNACLADFGIAKQITTDSSRTRAGDMVGSLAYIAPEQLRGEPVSPQTDIYTFGLVCFELLAGRRPFVTEQSTAMMYQQLHEVPPLLHEVVPGLPYIVAKVVADALQKDPARRPESVPAFLEAFELAVRDGLASGWPGLIANGHTLARLELSGTVRTQEHFLDSDNPYLGLNAFGEGDARNFFGREALIEQLVRKLAEVGPYSRALAVVGASGSGKSSVVRAGLLPAVRAGGISGSASWLIADLVPGIDPLKALAQALNRVSVRQGLNIEQLIRSDAYGLSRAIDRCLPPDEGCELLLVVDQFEELFTLTPDESSRVAFINAITTALLDPDSRLRIVFTLRADFLDRPLQYADLGEILRERTMLVPSMSLDELERAIVGPAKRLGLYFENGLIAAMLTEIGAQVGGLPLLQYALSELYLRRQNGELTLAALRAFGGIRGALAGRAEAAYLGLDESARRAAQQLMLRLTTLGEGSEDTRRRTARSELRALCSIHSGNDAERENTAALEAQDRAIGAFAAARLLTFDRDAASAEPTVEVAHEALLRSWDRLREWLSTARADMRLQRQLALASKDWREANGDASFLLRGNRLSQVQSLAHGELVVLSADERQFLQVSLDAVAQAEQLERERAERELRQARDLADEQQRAAASQRRGNRRLRWVVAAMAAVLAVSLWQGLQLRARSIALAEETGRANQEAKSASALSDFWAQLFATADPNLSKGKGRELTVVEVLESGLTRVQSDLKDSPAVQTRLLLTMARSFRQLGNYDQALQALDQAATANQANPKSLPASDQIDLLLERGRLLADRAEPEPALTALRAAQQLQEQTQAPPLLRATTLNIIASIYNDQSKLGEAEPLLRETLALRRQHGATPSEIATSLNNLAFTLLQLGHANEAEGLFREGATLRSQMQAEPSLDATLMLMNVAVAARDAGHFERAEAGFVDVREQLQRLLGAAQDSAAQHPILAALLVHEGLLASFRGRNADSIEKLNAAVSMQTALNDGNANAPSLVTARRERGRVLIDTRQFEAAANDLNFACNMLRERLGATSTAFATCQGRLATLANANGNDEQARSLADAALKALQQRSPSDLRAGLELATMHLLRAKLDPSNAATEKSQAKALLESASELVRARQLLEQLR